MSELDQKRYQQCFTVCSSFSGVCILFHSPIELNEPTTAVLSKTLRKLEQVWACPVDLSAAFDTIDVETAHSSQLKLGGSL